MEKEYQKMKLKSALSENIFAMCNIGFVTIVVQDGVKGIEADQVKSLEWYKKAAEGDYIDG
ncbi:6992_t:CDS:2 [Diversispora eburnea]|uniref:6992_t:CDS:1 n=1 Tax=Diversispora eburnea TaxID=1213867 RepID=A0A9N8YML8_9GLOM|nr:6992_t:CDS:2 [Diversispora eburnea]